MWRSLACYAFIKINCHGATLALCTLHVPKPLNLNMYSIDVSKNKRWYGLSWLTKYFTTVCADSQCVSSTPVTPLPFQDTRLFVLLVINNFNDVLNIELSAHKINSLKSPLPPRGYTNTHLEGSKI